MSEEKPTFKITDRRLFNPDGTPREIEREEEPPASIGTEDTAAGETGPVGEAERAAPTAQSTQTPGAAAGAAQPARAHDAGAEPQEEGDPQEFLMVVEFIASFAADALGMVEHPGAGRGEINLPLARQCIDMLVTLLRKTHGNLSAEEQHVFDAILSQLRLQYVRAANIARGGTPPARGFSGSDITGGR